ncbi:PQLLE family protein [Labilibaculum euxinus]
MPKSLQKSLEECRILVYGLSGNEAIKTRIAAIYPEKRILDGVKLYEDAKSAFESQSTEKIESTEANREFKIVYEKIYGQLVKIRKAGRYFFKNNAELRTLLRLNKEIPGNYADWKNLCEETTNAVLQHVVIQDKLALVELGSEKITEMAQQLEKIDELKIKAEKEDGEAQVATVRKQETFNKLMAYCTDLRACLDLFYERSERQTLEQLGILIK